MSFLSSSAKSESGFFAPSHTPLHPHNSDMNTAGERRPASRRSQRAIPSPFKAAAILAAFLPIPPILSIIYLVCGHAILRAAHSSHYNVVPLMSSVRAAAAGGAILALPLAVLLYLLLFPTKPPNPEDFFDDDEDTGELLTYGTYVACAALALTLGAISGALGTVCLPASSMISAGQAAAAGIVGGAVLWGGLAIVAGMSFLVWLDHCQPKADS
ncbi:hypothetical protein DFH07DRAFT_959005 [Mycena maculata]|uniref:Uncharacterized protein n=1 Tax=Mycena maculata TaxID=230809 RepID=A0AAD7J4N7_9AGAR|nr:hypothetical protein DFH07DRAFT_959005 [Mycena maculata]